MPRLPTKTWRLLPHDRSAVDQLARSLRVSALAAQLLLNRGLRAPELARRFLDAPLNGLHSPDLLPGIPAACECIFRALAEGKKICVYGDYDVDGVTGSAILLQCFRLLGAKVELYVPNRLEEGYGLNKEALKQIADSGSSLVVTVDCGIASVQEAREARRLGLQLIITDHHEMKADLPEADALVHPRLPGSRYPFGWLCGSAVAFKLAWALATRKCGGTKVTPLFRDFLLDAVALAALGVVADVVPLQDENRILVRYGLSRLRVSAPPGLRALCESAGLEPDRETLKASDVAFRLAPRLNAVGRLGQARLAVELLTTTRPEQAQELAQLLNTLNEQRQKLERDTVVEAQELIEKHGYDDHPGLVLARENWHPGILGIVAGRLTERYGRPALVLSVPGGPREGDARLAQGSGRSLPGLALHELLNECSDLLVSHGGHAAAAGFRLCPEHIDAFRERFCNQLQFRYPDGFPPPPLILDAEVPLTALTSGLVGELDKLEPYGSENRKPLFLASNLRLDGEPRKVGAWERHLMFRVRQGNVSLKAIGWSMADRLGELLSGQGACCLAFTPRINEWQGRRTVDLEVVDFQPSEEAALT